MAESFRDLFITELSEIRTALFGTDNPANQEIESLPQEHKQYAKLVGETYDGQVRDFGDYKYQKSLYINNFLTPVVTAYGVEKMAEATAMDVAKNVVARQTGLLRELGGRERLNYNFLEYLMPIVRRTRYAGEETTYIQDDSLHTEYTAEQADTLRPYLTQEYGGMLDHIDADNNVDWVTEAMDEIAREEGSEGQVYEVTEPYYNLWYEPDLYKYLPFSFIGVAMTAIAYKKALINMEVQEKEQTIFSTKKASERRDARISHYTKGNDDIFTIRGTKDTGDIANDAIMGLQEAIKSKTGISILSGALERKIELMEEFIINHKRENSNVVMASHSLGSLEMGILHKRLEEKGVKVKGVGFAHAVLPPREHEDLIYYSFKNDPLYQPSDKKNHYFINKPKSGKNIKEVFNNFHSINNYY